MCCGKNRTLFPRTVSRLPLPRTAKSASSPAQLVRNDGAAFEYIGRTGITVRGPVTGQQYRFDRPGARLEVDPRDKASIAAIPLLRYIPRPNR